MDKRHQQLPGPSANGIRTAFGTRTDGGTGTVLNFGYSLLQSSEGRGMVNRAIQSSSTGSTFNNGNNIPNAAQQGPTEGFMNPSTNDMAAFN